MKKLLRFLAPITLTAGMHAAIVDVKTVSFDGGSLLSSPIANRLFTLSGSTENLNRVPIGTSIWFVADTQNDGISTAPIAGSILETGDDVLLFSGSVAGPNSGTAGRYVHEGLSIPDTIGAGNVPVGNVDIYAYVWNSSSPSGASFVPVAGSKFGALNLGKTTFPSIGNGFWAIDQNIFSDVNTVQASAVPEAGEYASVAAFCLLGLAVVRRTKCFQK